MTISFLLGGARSGKSSLAVRRALDWQTKRSAMQIAGSVTFIATGIAGDAEMSARIQHHQKERPADWFTVGAPLHLAASVGETRSLQPDTALVIDCLSLWVANRLMPLFDAVPNNAVDANDSDGGCPDQDALAVLEGEMLRELLVLREVLRESTSPTWIVSNEVGGGLVPMNAMGRAYRDILGRVNATVSNFADDAALVVAGRVLRLERA
jgi:adenosylcobinamide kinase / adenosylcobinamide-phosphate guanylyltransferase